MIDIKAFREYISELVYETNQELENKIEHIVLSVNESHMTKKLQNKSGVCLCVSYPDAQAVGESDNAKDSQQAFIFVCQRVSPGQLDEEGELALYSELQHIMLVFVISCAERRVIVLILFLKNHIRLNGSIRYSEG